MRMVMTSTPEQVESFADDVKALTVEEAVATCRLMVADMKQQHERGPETQTTEPA